MTTETKSRKGIGGPKTAEGKYRIKLNALKTGLHAETDDAMCKIANVVGVSFDEVHQQMRDYYRPRDVVEETLVRRIARCTWRLAVIEAMEDHLLNRLRIGGSPSQRLEKISVMERRTDTQLYRAIQNLTAKRKQDRQNMKNKLADLPPPGKWPRPEPEFTEEAPQETGYPQPTSAREAHSHGQIGSVPRTGTPLAPSSERSECIEGRTGIGSGFDTAYRGPQRRR